MMRDVVRGVLEEFASYAHLGDLTKYWGDDGEGLSLHTDHKTAQAQYMRDRRLFDGAYKKQARAYMRDYNKRPERKAQRAQMEAVRRQKPAVLARRAELNRLYRLKRHKECK